MDKEYIAREALEASLELVEELADEIQSSFLSGQFHDEAAFIGHLKHLARSLRQASIRIDKARMRCIEGIALVKKMRAWRKDRDG